VKEAVDFGTWREVRYFFEGLVQLEEPLYDGVGFEFRLAVK
jgi:hypothetical protein